MNKTVMRFHDDILGVINYSTSTTLFNLDGDCFKKLLTEFRKVDQITAFTEQTIFVLSEVLMIVKSDMMILHKKDFDIILSVTLGDSNSLALQLRYVDNLLPFRNKNKSFLWKNELSVINQMTKYVADTVVEDDCFCKTKTGFLTVLKKIDSFLELDNTLYDDIVRTGIYPQLAYIPNHTFKIEFAEDLLTFESFFKGDCYNFFNLPFFRIHFHKGIIRISIAGQEIILTEQEFLKTPNQQIIDIIIELLKIKNLPIHSISNLKDYLLIQDMSKIK
jgi:hypothetical protein